ncbi:phosphatidate cytidylyltransferase [uncultured Paracoccus sp.]|uniref:phosphatidate cytidylyltransferase n=1 Tax=uncultured Paracoccus sp. TaxID=189685 RepID=UPI00261375C0|nr:phosphatidate cytidylyltransferase [uncultured Paracoccus sp.]
MTDDGSSPRRIPTAGRWGDLTRRLGSGIVVAVLGLAVLVAAGLWLRLAVAMLVGGLMWELVRMTTWRYAELHPRGHPYLIAFLAAVAFLIAVLAPLPWGPMVLLVPLLAGWRGVHVSHRVAYVGFAAAFFLAALQLVWVREISGLATTMWIVLTVIQSDVLGYFVGRAVGGPKFWPTVSPKKTWSGTVAGWVGAFVLAAGLLAAGRADWTILILGPLIAFAGQMGDIAESWLKRRIGVKDSSNLIPGHGGVMDRFDALIAALLVSFFAGLLTALPQLGA